MYEGEEEGTRRRLETSLSGILNACRLLSVVQAMLIRAKSNLEVEARRCRPSTDVTACCLNPTYNLQCKSWRKSL